MLLLPFLILFTNHFCYFGLIFNKSYKISALYEKQFIRHKIFLLCFIILFLKIIKYVYIDVVFTLLNYFKLYDIYQHFELFIDHLLNIFGIIYKFVDPIFRMISKFVISHLR